MNLQPRVAPHDPIAVEIRVRGRVQGVGFRPTVYRIARELGLGGEVRNDCAGVLIRVLGHEDAVADLVDRIEREAPPLARIDGIDQARTNAPLGAEFRIAASAGGDAHTEICPDAAICRDCAAEIVDPSQRRFRYPFANCTHCGPRLSIVTGVPYDRDVTSMAAFALCAACRAEYDDASDRRFHAEAIACHVCGPKARLVRFDGRPISFDRYSTLDDADAVASLLQNGEIVAIKGLGGYQLACDATNAAAVARLRQRKEREVKPFALMARDLDVIRCFATPDEAEQRALLSSEAPIVLLRANGLRRLPAAVAPGLDTIGFMLPTTPLHLLALRRMDGPVVMTSGNRSDAPQIIDDDEARARLAGSADFGLVHDRRIVTRLDDSVVRVMDGRPRLLRRGRGFAPAPIALPAGLETSPALLAFGGELKSAFCVIKDGQAILSQHIGDLEDASTFEDFQHAISHFETLFTHAPAALAADLHPDYLSSKLARERAAQGAVPLIEVQHHHAHVAACLADNARPLDAAPVLGIVLDGLGYGDDGTLWGGEFLLADYRRYERLGTFKPVAMPGGAQAVREPWRNLYAHLVAEMGWPQFAMNFSQLELFRDLEARPRAILDAMIRNHINAPPASSCGRLFDAAAAALGVARERQAYEGQAAMQFESIVDRSALRDEDEALGYPFTIPNLRDSGLPYVEPLGMWQALLGDLILDTPAGVIAARFHKGLAKVVAGMARKLAGTGRFDTVALSGGCFQNAVLFSETARRLEAAGFRVLSHSRVPMNDGGLALGQAAIAAARLTAEG
jgi:hydrogenase maturation protein HypF